ncbi:MAG: gamma-glutamylcyclotransferase [Ectothiorhodospiraceae bacterium]|nr:gamma-glutamylcyclotransferase [Ectothiorhodospiraceae bacterium]MCH8502728.1 gamma-glutamylcyclotransferase [Ectothiorhodospiraceae bacterium]
MSVNTIAANRAGGLFHGQEQVWLFGYGSLIYKVDFPYLERRPASIRGWARRFWQGSHDHRGTPDTPGRVVTLVPAPETVCAGMAYLIGPEVFDHLDCREKNGYLRFSTEMTFSTGDHAQGLVYIATEDNAAFLGPAPEPELATQIARSVGPSGSNREYLLLLAESLRAMGESDPHVFAIERRVLALESRGARRQAG